MNKNILIIFSIILGGTVGYAIAKVNIFQQETAIKTSELEKQTECTTGFISGTTGSLVQHYIGMTNDIRGYYSFEEMDEDIKNFENDVKKIDKRISKCNIGVEENKIALNLRNNHIANIQKIKTHKKNLKAFKSGNTLVSEQYPRYKISASNGWRYENGYYVARDGENGLVPMNYISYIEH